MTFALSFAPDFFVAPDRHDNPKQPTTDFPNNVWDAINGLSRETWHDLARQVFSASPTQLDVSAVLARVIETNTCRNLDAPVEVFIDPEGDFTLSIHDSGPVGQAITP